MIAIAAIEEIRRFDPSNPLGDPWRVIRLLQSEVEASKRVNEGIMTVLRSDARNYDALIKVEEYLLSMATVPQTNEITKTYESTERETAEAPP
jgi:hypothetical protein